MLIGYKDDENDAHTSTHTSSIDIQPSSENVTRLVLSIGKEEMSVKSMMEAVGLKNRPNFMDYSLTPAIREGFVCMKYPANPHHPRQRYLLTIRVLMLLDGNIGLVLNKSKAFVRYYPKNLVSLGQMVKQKQASPIWETPALYYRMLQGLTKSKIPHNYLSYTGFL